MTVVWKRTFYLFLTEIDYTQNFRVFVEGFRFCYIFINYYCIVYYFMALVPTRLGSNNNNRAPRYTVHFPFPPKRNYCNYMNYSL